MLAILHWLVISLWLVEIILAELMIKERCIFHSSNAGWQGQCADGPYAGWIREGCAVCHWVCLWLQLGVQWDVSCQEGVLVYFTDIYSITVDYKVHLVPTALLGQKEASDKSDISYKRAKCVCHFHWRQWNIMMSYLTHLLAGWVFMHTIWPGRIDKVYENINNSNWCVTCSPVAKIGQPSFTMCNHVIDTPLL